MIFLERTSRSKGDGNQRKDRLAVSRCGREVANQEAARRAREAECEPFVPEWATWVDSWPPFPFSNLGGFIPEGWKRTGSEWFVDKTGWGTVDELALTVEQFKTVLRVYIPGNPGHGFAITEEGPFQGLRQGVPARSRKTKTG